MASSARNGVTIGVPLYNEERYVEATLRAAAPQCETLTISDNASTDRSVEVCEASRREHANITLVRQPQNTGAWNNFRFVLDSATTPYFMWLGGHDLLPPGYVDGLVAALASRPDAVLAFGSTRYIDANGDPQHTYECDFGDLLADPSPATRTLALIRLLSDCAMIHGVFRTGALQAAFRACGSGGYLGVDHVLLGHAALEGPFVYQPTVQLTRRNPHSGDTTGAQLHRIHGAAASAPPPPADTRSRVEMQRQQYAMAVATSREVGPAALLYRLRARYHLVSRFGPFGESPVEQRLDRVLRRRLVTAAVGRFERLYDGWRLRRR